MSSGIRFILSIVYIFAIIIMDLSKEIAQELRQFYISKIYVKNEFIAMNNKTLTLVLIKDHLGFHFLHDLYLLSLQVLKQQWIKEKI